MTPPLRVVCMSKGRSRTIRQDTLRLFPDLTLVVDEAEADDYAGLVPDDRLFTHPGLFPPIKIAIWISKKWADEDLVYVGDDTKAMFAMPGWGQRRYTDPEVVQAVLLNTRDNAMEAGAYVFGFASNTNPITYEPQRPIKLSSWVTNPFGLRAGHGLKFDERITLQSDVNTCLESLMKHRIIWADRRWGFVGRALNNAGGNTGFRSAERAAKEQKILKAKWGPYVHFDMVAMKGSQRYADGLPATTMMTYVNVPRRQADFG